MAIMCVWRMTSMQGMFSYCVQDLENTGISPINSCVLTLVLCSPGLPYTLMDSARTAQACTTPVSASCFSMLKLLSVPPVSHVAAPTFLERASDISRCCCWLAVADEPEGIRQGFSIIVACFGLAAFALVLALVEQVVLESMENNVKQGSRVFESGHVSGVLLLLCQ